MHTRSFILVHQRIVASFVIYFLSYFFLHISRRPAVLSRLWHLWFHTHLGNFNLFRSVGMKEIYSKMLQCCVLNGGIFWVCFTTNTLRQMFSKFVHFNVLHSIYQSDSQTAT